MNAPAKKYVIARRSNHGGLGLAELVKMGAKTATIRRLKGSRFRLGRVSSFPPVVVPAGDVIRPATHRELVLGYPV